MSLILAIVAVLCGIALILELDTGTLTHVQVAGVAILCLAAAILEGPVRAWAGK